MLSHFPLSAPLVQSLLDNLIISLEFSFHSFWQTFLNFCLLQGPQPPGCDPETSKNLKKSAKGNEK